MWQSLRNRRNRTWPHICLDPGLHSSRICPLPLGHGCFACPQIRDLFEVTVLYSHDPQERPGWWQMNRVSLNAIHKDMRKLLFLCFLFFFNWGDKAVNCLFYMFLMINIFMFRIFLLRTGHLKCCSAQHGLCLPVW